MNRNDLLKTYHLPLPELINFAESVNKAHANIELCSIINAKSGACSEDCKYCAQSAHYDGEAKVYPLLNREEILKSAVIAQKNGAKRYGIVTSGVSPTPADFVAVLEAVSFLAKRVEIKIDASLGILTFDELASLKEAGLSRYHHNLETSREFFPRITTTHTYETRYEVAQNTIKCGLELCCGGIFGIGEEPIDRISLALDIAKLAPTAIPINFLVPIKGTPLETIEKISAEEALRTIAIFRIICKDCRIVLAGGRSEVLKNEQKKAFNAGANGMIIGDLLTTTNEEIENDKKLLGCL